MVRLPLVGVRSLIATGSPCSGPSLSPRMTAASAFLASPIASSGKVKQKQLILGFTCSMRARLFLTELDRRKLFRPDAARELRRRRVAEIEIDHVAPPLGAVPPHSRTEVRPVNGAPGRAQLERPQRMMVRIGVTLPIGRSPG